LFCYLFFYDRYLNTALYVVLSVTFVRPGFGELFHIDPALEYGRNGFEKLDATPMKEWTLYRLSGEALDRLADKTG
jgi:hypothetical protein